jgi:hypothetical protein
MVQIEQVSVDSLARTGQKRHYRAILVADLSYYLRNSEDVCEIVGENRFKSAQGGFMESINREEAFSLIWYSMPNDPFSVIGEERLGRRITRASFPSIDDKAIEAVKSGNAEFTEITDKQAGFYARLIKNICGRISVLEKAGHKVIVDVSGRIKIGKDGMKVYGNPGTLVRMHETGGYSFFRK